MLLGMLAMPLRADLWSPLHASGAGSLLEADQAFQLVGAERKGNGVTVRWQIAPGYYLYRDRLQFTVAAPADTKLGAPSLPPGQRTEDENGHTIEIYHDDLSARLNWRPGTPAPQRLRVGYQGCAEAGFCYPPQVRMVDVLDSKP